MGEGGENRHVVYEVEVKSTRAGWSVFKRFSEFDALHKAILGQNPRVPLPELPGKFDMSSWINPGALDVPKIEQRRESLERMLRGLLKLSEAISLDIFLPFLDLDSVWRACHYGDVDHLIFLATHGYQVSKQDENGRTPLHLVVDTGNIELARVLLSHSDIANLEIEDMNGKTALAYAQDYASESGNMEMVTLLTDAMEAKQAEVHGFELKEPNYSSPNSASDVTGASSKDAVLESPSSPTAPIDFSYIECDV